MDNKLDPELYIDINNEDGTEEVVLFVKYVGDIDDMVPGMCNRLIKLLNNYAVMYIYRDRVMECSGDSRIIYMEANRPVQLGSRSESRTDISRTPAYYGAALRGEGVKVAFIDSGIDYGHEQFLTDGITRVEVLWDQSAIYDQNRINEYGIGTVYELDELQTSLDNYEYLSRDRSGHGTEVAGICCGNTTGRLNRAGIWAVKLNTRNGESNIIDLIMGIDFCMRRALEEMVPLVINLSYGNNYGAHNGKSMAEEYIDSVSGLTTVTIIGGSGNYALSGLHTSGDVGMSEDEFIDIAVYNYSRSFNVSIWYNPVDIFDVGVMSPGGSIVMNMTEYQRSTRAYYGDTVIDGIMFEPTPVNTLKEIYIGFNSNTYIYEGVWRIVLIPRQAVAGSYNAYLPISSDVRFSYPVTASTLTIPGTGNRIITVGAYDSTLMDIAGFSGRGYTTDNRVKPDIAAPGVDIYTAYPGNRYVYASGTSMAVPYVSGIAGSLMEWGIVNNNDRFMYGEKVKAALTKMAEQLDIFKNYPNIYVGYGIL